MEWVENGLAETDENGKKFWAYGGDYGTDMPSDGNFVCDGLIDPGRVPHPAVAEVKYVHQNFAFEAIDLSAGIFKVINRHYFSNLDNYDFLYDVTANGKIIY